MRSCVRALQADRTGVAKENSAEGEKFQPLAASVSRTGEKILTVPCAKASVQISEAAVRKASLKDCFMLGLSSLSK
jgi:hypothetical protein